MSSHNKIYSKTNNKLAHYVTKVSNSLSILPLIHNLNSSIDSTNPSIDISAENSLEIPKSDLKKRGVFDFLGKKHSQSIELPEIKHKKSFRTPLPKISKRNSKLQADSFLFSSSRKVPSFTRTEDLADTIDLNKSISKETEIEPFFLETEEDELKKSEDNYSVAHSKRVLHLKTRKSVQTQKVNKALKADLSDSEINQSPVTEGFRNKEGLLDINKLVTHLKIHVQEGRKKEVIQTIDKIRSKGDEISIPEFKLELTSVVGRLFLQYGDMNNAIKYLKLYRDFSKFLNKPMQKLKAYKYLAYLFQSLNRPEKALIFLKKMLKLAWVMKRADFELLAYDLIGKQYYYMANLKKATLFHNRMMKGVLEPKDSVIRRVGEEALRVKEGKTEAQKNVLLLNRANNISRNSISLQQALSDSEDSFDLEIFSLSSKKGKGPATEEQMTRDEIVDLSHAIYKQRNKEITRKAQPPRMKEKKAEPFTIKYQERLKRLVIPPKNVSEKILLNHLSPCRDIQNYNLLEFQNISGATHQDYERSKIFRKNKISIINMLKKFEKFIEDLALNNGSTKPNQYST